jgi:hypothetical protein
MVLPKPPAAPTVELSGPLPVVPAPIAYRPSVLKVGLVVAGAAMLVTVLVVALQAGDGDAPPEVTTTAAPPAAVAVDEEAAPEATAETEEPRTYAVALEIEPEGSTIELDGRAVGVGRWSDVLIADGTSHVLLIQHLGFIPQALHFADTPPPSSIVLLPLPAGAVAIPERRTFVRPARGATSTHTERAGGTDAPTGAVPAAEPETLTGTVPASEPETLTGTVPASGTDTTADNAVTDAPPPTSLAPEAPPVTPPVAPPDPEPPPPPSERAPAGGALELIYGPVVSAPGSVGSYI